MKTPSRIVFWTTLSIWFFVFLLLTTGSNWLLMDWGGVPSGTYLTWAGLICLPLSIYYGSKPLRTSISFGFRVIRFYFLLTLLINMGWGFVSHWLAGNWNFNFEPKDTFVGSPQAYYYFYVYTLAAVSMSVLLLFWLITFTYLLKRKRKNL